MASKCPDVIVYVCKNCVPQGERLPSQWQHEGAWVVVREVPCSGKTDAQYLLHAIEGGGRGLCVVTCAQGECRLAQGNYRAEVRVGTIRRLLNEVGIEPQRAELLRCPAEQSFAQFHASVREAVARISALGANPVGARASAAAAGGT